MIGILESILRKRYGSPRVVQNGPLIEYRWNETDESRSSILYKDENFVWGRNSPEELIALKPIYGDAIGGFLLGDSFKVATLGGHELWGLYTLPMIQDLPPIHRALELEPGIGFFMDAANVWFYGAKDGILWEYDEPFDEIWGEVDIATRIDQLLDQWERA
jgi:hypothetical protein